MKLYSYSSESNTFVKAKWVIAKYVTVGIIIGVVIFFGFIKLNQSVGNVLGLPSINTFASDNNFLRQQVSLISPRVGKLEMQTQQLNERGNTFRTLLHRGKIVVDTVSSFTDTTKGFKIQSLTPAVISFHP